jgi:predicted DNA-binding transcriptional regulator AlpA
MPHVTIFTTEEAAALLKVHPRTLFEYRDAGTGPKFIRLSPRVIRYRLEDLEEWMAENTLRQASNA